MRSWILAFGLTSLIGSFVACSSTPETGAPVSLESNDASTDVPVDPTPDASVDPTAEACAKIAGVVKPAVDSIRKKARTTDIGVGLITQDCPFVPILSGQSNLSEDARFRIGSITKTYTAAVILHFVAEGSIGLDDAIARFDLGIPSADAITLRQLLNHTSGLFNYTEAPEFSDHLDWTPKQRIEAAVAHEPYFAPGKGWHYSNTNYVVLGSIAEKLGGAPIEALIRSLVLVPNHFDETYFAGVESASGELAPAFTRVGVPLASKGPEGEGAWADGALVASLRDVTRWVRAYASGDATPKLKSDLLATVPTDVSYANYGLGLMRFSADTSGGNGASYGHNGDIPGFHSMSFYFPDRQWTITVIVNTDTGDPNAILVAVMDALAEVKK